MNRKIEIIELVGLPGSGKTTLVQNICSINSNIITRQELINKKITTLFRNFVYYLSVRKSVEYTEYKSYLKKLISKYPQKNLYYYRLLCKLFCILKKCKTTKTIILDEGFIQNITSISHTKEIDRDENLLLCLEIIKRNFDIKVVKCSVKNDIAINRIIKRNKGDRISKMSMKELSDFLVIKNENLNTIANEFDVVKRINMENSENILLKEVSSLIISE